MNRVTHVILYEVDWAGVSTVVLTVITGYYAWSTRKMLEASSRQAAAAERTLEVLLEERTRKREQHVAPIGEMIRQGLTVVDKWLRADLGALTGEDNSISGDFEVPELPGLIAHSRSLHFAMAQALSTVEGAIMSVRGAVDEIALVPGEQAFSALHQRIRTELEKLRDAWARAEHELGMWQ